MKAAGPDANGLVGRGKRGRTSLRLAHRRISERENIGRMVQLVLDYGPVSSEFLVVNLHLNLVKGRIGGPA